jgi:hypothetical protein
MLLEQAKRPRENAAFFLEFVPKELPKTAKAVLQEYPLRSLRQLLQESLLSWDRL